MAPIRVFRSAEEVPGDFGPSSLTIGNFDGVHVGHQAIFQATVSLAESHGWTPSALTFDPHPTRVVAPHRAPKLMTTLEHRCELMGESGIRQVLILPFEESVAGLEAHEFVEQYLVGLLGVKSIQVGSGFRFGRGQGGDTALLRSMGERLGFTISVIPAVTLRGMVVSSSGIRQSVEAGNLEVAGRMLGRPFSLRGKVVSGHGIGSRATVPTLNLEPDSELLPATGVYATRTGDLASGQEWDSVTNVGYRPTFGGDALTIETFLLSKLEGSAPGCIEVEFCRHLREERRFASPEALRSQIMLDVSRAQTYFRRLRKWRKM